MMKSIKIDFLPELFLPQTKRTGGFIEDIDPKEVMEAGGFFQPPMYSYEENKRNESQHNDKNYARVLKKESKK